MTLFQGFLFAHVIGAIIAFGPTFSFPIIGRLGAVERQHSSFATRLSKRLSEVQVVPFAILQGITGVALIVVGSIDVMAHAWLMVGIALYVVALGFALFVQTPTVKKIIEMTSGGPPAGPPPGAGGPPAGGPPPELMRLVRRVQLGGLFLMALIVSIVFLMVVKPGA
ncbi:MAG TPA: DUF2269 family protein [Candidatus Limnocylindrales bacterium]|nr:DUF2269 family protein [Candidatus Limnocylindrales bacterium]